MKTKPLLVLLMVSWFIWVMPPAISPKARIQNIDNTAEKSISSPRNQRIEAETMNLTHYKIDSIPSTTFIKLTSSTGVARFNFPFASATYDIDARYLSESAGQNTYTMTIAGNQIVAWLGKDRDDGWHMLSEQKWHVPKNIAIRHGDEIKIEALSETGSKVILDYIEFKKSSRSSSATQQSLVTIYPEEYDHAIKNPLKGFRPKIIYSNRDRIDHEYGTLVKMYFRWNQLENRASDGVDKIKKYCDKKWRGIEEINVKMIPRVELQRPGAESGWPADMTTGDFTSDHFKQRVIAFIQKLGQAWDNDPRVAYIEMGIVGEWGEME